MFAYMGLLDVSIKANKKEDALFAAQKLKDVIAELEKQDQGPQGGLKDAIDQLIEKSENL